jgi:hypothetical protein
LTDISASGAVTLSGGTANGVTYLNGSKVLTSGSALTFDGTNLGVLAGSVTTPAAKIHAVGNVRSSNGAGTVYSQLASDGVYSSGTDLYLFAPTGYANIFYANNAEQMRLTSTGLGIGTSSPSGKFHTAFNATGNQFAYFTNNQDANTGISLSTSTRTWWMFVGDSASNALRFYDSTASAERMRLDSAGSLLVGTTTDPTAGALARGIVSIKQLNDTSQTSGLQIEANANTNVLGLGYNGSTFAIGSTYRSTGSYVPVSFWTGGSERARINNDGNLLLGTTTDASAKIRIAYASGYGIRIGITATTGTLMQFVYETTPAEVGSITSTTTSVAYNTSSDYRLKNITGPLTNSGVYIDSLNPVEGTWKANGSTFVGLIAHEVQESSRTQVATGTKDGEKMQAMDYSNAELIANLIAEVKSLRVRVAQLETN